MSEIGVVLTKLSDILEQDNRGVSITCYSVALIGLTVAIRKVRPFSRFKKPGDIPQHFIEQRVELKGYVNRIEPNGSLLMIKHEPLIKIGSSKAELPVKISEVNVSPLGISWLQAIVAGNQVKFVPVKKEKDVLHCEVILPQKTADKKLRIVNIGPALVSISFGTIAERPLMLNEKHLNYYKLLQKAEIEATRKKLGIRYYIIPTMEIISAIRLKLRDVLNTIVRKYATVGDKKLVVS